MAREREELTALDAIAAVTPLLAVAICVLFSLVVTPSLSRTIASHPLSPVPLFARVAAMPWMPALLSAPLLAFPAASLVIRGGITLRRVLLLCGMGLSVALVTWLLAVNFLWWTGL